MKVYFRPPVYEDEELIFPNSDDVPPGYRSPSDSNFKLDGPNKDYFQAFQRDLMRLTERVAEFLEKSSMIGNAIIFYHNYPIAFKGEMKKLGLEPVIFSFGCMAMTDGGESELVACVKGGVRNQIEFEVRGEGICAALIEKVVKGFNWHSDIVVVIRRFSDYLDLVQATFNKQERERRFQNYYAFNLPASELTAAEKII